MSRHSSSKMMTFRQNSRNQPDFQVSSAKNLFNSRWNTILLCESIVFLVYVSAKINENGHISMNFHNAAVTKKGNKAVELVQ